MQHTQLIKNSLQLSILSAAMLLSASAAAKSNCTNVYYASQDSDQMHIVNYAEPDLPPIILEPQQKKKQKSSVSLFSWLTKSHTMASLHFIDFIELFDNHDE